MTVQARILIVDDEQPLVNLLTQAFRQEGHRTMTASNGIDCMNRMASFRPDVVIMDIMMPKLDGIDTTRLIRRNRSYAGTTIIALSAKSDEETRAKMKEAGAALFMRKPFSVMKLVERVGRMLAPDPGIV
ncbi:two-component system response regulator [bacterium CG17_big_fil_post_rev_8_21_14_2_50_64_8]|nr:MAG: two-component system response regulator [bacterium CG17_big_fil_post_rev_8_21_14_2_50_64_8]PJA75047.1 MAG: two-component system response regulator [bacterium CG_4_9_14_3_um_filter_65_15]